MAERFVGTDAFVGRREQLGVLTDLVVRSRESNQAVFVTGEPGSGKTRLAEVLARAAEEAGVHVVWGRPQQYAEELPYLCFLQIASQLEDSRKADSAPLLSESSDEWASLSVDAGAARTQYVLRVARSVAERAKAAPLLLVVDDLQWADVASLLLLSTLADLPGHGLLILCLSRPDTGDREDARGLIKATKAGCHQIALNGLSASEVSELAAETLGLGVLSSSEASTLCQWTQGNPLFVRTLLEHLSRTGLLSAHGMEEALQRSETPRAASEAVDAVITDLGTDVRRMLSAASVLGDEFECHVLTKLTQEAEERTVGLLRAAREAGAISSDGYLGRERARFGHPLFRQRCYELLSLSEQRSMHARVVELAELGVLELSDAELATHHARSAEPGVNNRVVAHCRAAATQAELFLAYESAGRFWEMALDYVDFADVQTRAELLKRRGWALWAGNSWRRSEEAWSQAIRLYEGAGNKHEIAELALALGDMMRWRQELELSESWLRRALLDLPEESANRARALAFLGSILCLKGESPEGLKTIQEAVRATEAGGRSDPRIDYWLSYALLRGGNSSLGMEIAERGLIDAERVEDAHSIVLLAGTLSQRELADLQPEAAEAYLSRMDAGAAQDDPSTIVHVLQARAYHLGYAGAWRQVAELCETTRAKLRLVGSYQVASVDVLWAEAQFALGNWQGATRAMTDALPHLEAMQEVCKVHIARVLAASGGGDDESIGDVSSYLDAALEPGLARSGVAVVADAAAALQDPALWQPAYDLVKRESAHMSFVYSPTSVGRVRGRLATRLRWWDEAIEHFEAASQRLLDGGAISELRRSLQDYAVMRRARGRRGDSSKADALDLRAASLAYQETWPSVDPYVAPSDANEFGLSGREVEVLQLVAVGLRNKEVADQLSISPHTVERHLENIYSKMDVRGRAEAVTRAAERGVLATS